MLGEALQWLQIMNWANIAVSLGLCHRAPTAERYVCPLNEATRAPALVHK